MKAMELGNFVRDKRTCNTFDATSLETEITQLKEAIKRLPERARYVLVRRYGLDDTKAGHARRTLGRAQVSRERI